MYMRQLQYSAFLSLNYVQYIMLAVANKCDIENGHLGSNENAWLDICGLVSHITALI